MVVDVEVGGLLRLLSLLPATMQVAASRRPGEPAHERPHNQAADRYEGRAQDGPARAH